MAMVVPKKSSTDETSVAKFKPSLTPSKIPRPDSRKDGSLPPFRTAVPRAAVLDLNGRIMKRSSSRDDCPVAVQTTETTSNKHISIPSEPSAVTEDRLLMEQVSRDILQRDGSVIIRTIQTVSLDNMTTATLTEISNKPSNFNVGDNRCNQASFNYIHEADDMPSSTVRENDQSKNITSRCSFVNICEKKCNDEKSKRTFPWELFCLTLLIAVLLGITVLVNYDHLLAIWYGQQFHKDIVVPSEDSYFEQWMNAVKRLWTELKNFIALDELEL